MRLRDRLIRGRKVRPVGRSLEHGPTANERGIRRRKGVVKGALIGVLTLLALAAFPRGDFFQQTVQVGEEWQRDAFVAPFDFPIYKSDTTLARERQAVRLEVPPFFEDLPGAQAQLTANRDTVLAQLQHIFEAYETYKINYSRGRLDEATADSLRYISLRRIARPKLNAAQWQRLLNDHISRVPGLLSASRSPASGEKLSTVLMRDAWEFGSSLIQQGVLDIPRDSIFTEELIIRNQAELSERRKQKDQVYGLNEAYAAAQNYFEREYGAQSELVGLSSSMLRSIFVPSLRYMRLESTQALQRAQDRISPTRGKVTRGEVLVNEGQRVTDEIKLKLTSLERALNERVGPTILWRRTLGEFLLVLSTFAIFFLYLFMVRQPIFGDNRKIFLISLLFAAIIGLFAVALRLPVQAMYAVPVVIVSVLLTVIFDSRVGLFGTLTLALLGGLLQGYDFEYVFATLFAGTLGVFSVRDIKNRGQFFVSAGLVFLGYAIVLGATWLFLNLTPIRLGESLLLAGVGSFFLILAYPLLWVFERAFDITTDLTLLELSDTNRPLLKELSLRAPGTFNHSLQVANLAEAAAAAIGANALLTRVGALYHDIGKMLKPEYFVENQRTGTNPHDQLKPRMSALIIASHVKEGLEMGRQYNLPHRVLDFIPMHHGTTRIEFFYRKAQDERKEGDPPVAESEFRYPGPRPHTKETGILMLADGVEAASKSLADPTHKRLESLIDMIIAARIEDGQLDDTELTFRDLNKIKSTFLTLLLGIYHVRVKYPDQQKGEKEQIPEEGESKEKGSAKGAPQLEEKEEPSDPVSASGEAAVVDEEIMSVAKAENDQDVPRLPPPASE